VENKTKQNKKQKIKTSWHEHLSNKYIVTS